MMSEDNGLGLPFEFDWERMALDVAEVNAEQAEMLAGIASEKQPTDPLFPAVEVMAGLVEHAAENLRLFLKRHEVKPEEDDGVILQELHYQALVRGDFIQTLAGSRAGDDS